MKNFKFLLRIFKSSSIKTLLDISKKISKEKNKMRLFIIIDMIYCGIVYGAAFHDYQEFEFYNLNRKQRKTYLTRGINNKIVNLYNNKEYWEIFNDKTKFNDLFKDFIKRDTINLNNCSLEEFKNFTKNKDKIIVKPNCGEGGKGISIIDLKDKNIKNLYEELIENKTTLVEELIKQHEKLNKLYDKSVNSLRMFTFQHDNKAYFLQAILKIGNGGIVDNFSSGGMYTFADENGFIITPAIDRKDDIYEIHPVSKCNIVEFEVPFFKEAVELVKKASFKVPEVGYIGWDVAITDKGPIIIEGNCYPGVFQIKPSLSKEKIGILKKYKEVMKIK